MEWKGFCDEGVVLSVLMNEAQRVSVYKTKRWAVCVSVIASENGDTVRRVLDELKKVFGDVAHVKVMNTSSGYMGDWVSNECMVLINESFG